MKDILNGRAKPIEVAKQIMTIRYPEAPLAFVAGSYQRGEATASSDIDLVVIYKKLEFAWRESFQFEGWPVEVFVHDPETLNYFFNTADANEGIPALASMVVEGEMLSSQPEFGNELKAKAQEVLDRGAPAWDEEAFKQQRYFITDLVDDLRSPLNAFEAKIIVGALQEALGNFYFRSKGLWSAKRKHLPRRLNQHDLKLAKYWISTFEKAFDGDATGVIALAEEVLRPYGGFYFNGYRREAPFDWRSPSE